jgi:hypothetical protein
VCVCVCVCVMLILELLKLRHVSLASLSNNTVARPAYLDAFNYLQTLVNRSIELLTLILTLDARLVL